jgi:hypothetical protein
MKKKIDSLSAGKQAASTEPAKTEEAPKETPAAAPEEKAAPAAEATPEAIPEAKPAEPAAEASADVPVGETAPGDSFESLFPEPSNIGKPPSWLWWFVLLIASVVVAFVGYTLAQKNLRDWLSLEPTASPSASATPTPTAEETAASTPTPEATPTPTTVAVVPAEVTLLQRSHCAFLTEQLLLAQQPRQKQLSRALASKCELSGMPVTRTTKRPTSTTKRADKMKLRLLKMR